MYTKRLSSVSWEDKNVGNKAANIGELMKIGMPVPPGFVITSDGFEKFLKVNKIDGKIRDILSKINTENITDVYNRCGQIRELILKANMPDFLEREIKEQYEELSIGQNVKDIGKVALDIIKAGREHEPVAIRSSPLVEDIRVSSYSGQLIYSLNVAGIDNIFTAIKKSWASLFSPRMIFYRKARNIEGILLMGIIVQKMVNPEKSGVLFTADPVSNDTSKIIIDSAWGLSDSVIYGHVKPDNYIVEKQSETVVKRSIGRKKTMHIRDPLKGGTKIENVLEDKVEATVLEAHEISRLVELSKRIENNYNGQPQNIEWCSERGRIFIVESKPIKSANMTPPDDLNINLPSVTKGITVSPGHIEGKVRIVLNKSDISKIEQDDVIVSRNIQPDMIPIMNKVSGIITDEGSYTGYTSVISREFGIPCVIRTDNATSILRDEQMVTMDAFNGIIYSNEAQPQISQDVSRITEPQEIMESVEDDITGTSVMLNISTSNIENETIQKSDGIGLFRSEHILTSMGRRPVTLSRTNPEELISIITSTINRIAETREFWYRSFDVLTDDLEDYTEYEVREKNPIMGWHGIRRSLDQPEILRCEIEAMRRLYSQGRTNIGLILPFVTRPEEIRNVKSMITFPLKLGISVDSPASALRIEELCKEGIDHVSINLSLLSQLTLGVDTENPKISRHYSELDPSVIHLIKHVVKSCRSYRIKTSITNSTFDDRMLEEFVKTGVDIISVDSDTFHSIKPTLSRIERRLLLEHMRGKS